MRKKKDMDDVKRLAILQEHLSSASPKVTFEREKGLPHGAVSRRLHNFAVEDKPQATKTTMTMDTYNDTQTVLDADGETARLRKELRAKELELKHAAMARDAYEKTTRMRQAYNGMMLRKKRRRPRTTDSSHGMEEFGYLSLVTDA